MEWEAEVPMEDDLAGCSVSGRARPNKTPMETSTTPMFRGIHGLRSMRVELSGAATRGAPERIACAHRNTVALDSRVREYWMMGGDVFGAFR